MIRAAQWLGYVLDRDFVADQEGLRWFVEAPSQVELEAAMRPAAKAARIAKINAECCARLLARYGPAEEQVSRAIGVYGATEQADMQAGIAATIDASNTASNAVLAAADIAAVEAVTVTWPAI